MLTGVAVVLLVVIALLAIPVSLTFQVSWPKVVQNDVYLRWAFGLVRVRIPPPQAAKDTSNDKNSKHEKRSSEEKSNAFLLIRQQAFRRRIIRYVGDLWYAVHKENVELHIRAGLDNPADTGQLWAILGPVSGVLANIKGASISIAPEFSDETFEIHSRGHIRVVPLQLLFLTIALLFSPPVWQGFRQMRLAGR